MFSVFSSINGLFVSFFVGNDAKTMKIIKDVIKIIGIVFVAMFTLGGVLLAGGIAFGTWALIFMIVLLILLLLYRIFGTNTTVMYIFGSAIFTALIAIDTNMILQDNYEEKNTPINASMRYYLDILNLYKIIFRRKLGK
jgi:FtsH-binding integral membrane protein